MVLLIIVSNFCLPSFDIIFDVMIYINFYSLWTNDFGVEIEMETIYVTQKYSFLMMYVLPIQVFFFQTSYFFIEAKVWPK